jgi:hypothetical protein
MSTLFMGEERTRERFSELIEIVQVSFVSIENVYFTCATARACMASGCRFCSFGADMFEHGAKQIIQISLSVCANSYTPAQKSINPLAAVGVV